MASMDRSRRIRAVIALTLGLISLIASVSIQLVMTYTNPTFVSALDSASDVTELKENIGEIEQAARVSNTLTGIMLLIGIACFAYCLLLWAPCFVGPSEATARTSTDPANPSNP